MIAFIKKHAAVIIGILVIITVSTVVLTFVIANNHNNVNTTSSEDSDNIQLLNETFRFDFTDDQIYELLTNYDETDAGPSTEVVIKFKITDEQMKMISDYSLDCEYNYGEKRFLNRENIPFDSIAMHSTTWGEKVTKESDSSVDYQPYTIFWYVMDKSFDDKYDAAAWTYLPYKADIDAKE